MELNTLRTYLDRPEVHRWILAGYDGPYSLGIGADPRLTGPVLILRVVATTKRIFPNTIKLEGEVVPIVVKTDFKVPSPLHVRRDIA